MSNEWRQHRLWYARLKRIRAVFGVAGVSMNSPRRVRKWGNFFEWAMLIIVFWLPIQWYLEKRQILPAHLNVIADWMIWIAFVVETVTMVSMVKRKVRYLVTNWLNLVIIVVGFPLLWTYFPLLATVRITRVLFMISILVPWLPLARDFLSRNHLGATLLISVILTFLSGILISVFDSGIPNPLDGVWWAWETVTTVGYGDVVPTTVEGRILAIFVMVMGLGLFSLLTANFSAFLIGRNKREEDRQDKLIDQIKELSEKIDKLEEKMDGET
jgi:voltage-gated potassium channel